MRRSLLALALASLSLTAAAKPVAEPVSWSHGGTNFDGYLVYDDSEGDKRPGLVMVPNWMGVNESAIEKAKTIAGDDYVILLVDMYGRGVRPDARHPRGRAGRPRACHRQRRPPDRPDAARPGRRG